MDLKRVCAGFALAPLPILAPFFLMVGLASAPVFVIVQFLLLGYGVTLAVGLPVHLVLTMARRQDLLDYLAATAIVILALAGALTVYSRWIFAPVPHGNPFAFPLLWNQYGVGVTMASLVMAGIAAAVFWAIAVRATRDQQVEAVTPLTG